MKKVTVLLLVALFLFLPSASIAKGTQVVVFDDPVLETALRKEVGIPEGDVTDKDLAKVTSLGIGRNYEQNPDPNTQVQSIAVLAYCSKLSTLELNFQNITDISPLANLKKMKTLELGGNPIADITPLTNMTALETLKLFNCQAQDYSPLAKLKKLSALYLEFSTISDLTPLSGLTKLKTLGLKGTAISDVTPLAKLTALRTLYLSECDIKDYSPIEKIYGKLTDKDFEFIKPTPTPVGVVVAFDDPVLENAIRQALNKPEGDVYSYELASLTDLGTGFSYEREPAPDSRVRSIGVLKYCNNLVSLELNFNQIEDVSALAGLTNLEQILIGGNPVADVTPFAGLTNLRSLGIFNCQAQDYSPLANLTNLEDLSLDYSTITDLTPLAGLVHLNRLSLNYTDVLDVTPLSGLTSLRTLNLKDCPVTDYTPLAAVIPNLTSMEFDPDHPATVIQFTDPVLESLIRQALNKPEGIVLDKQAAGISDIGFERFDDRPAEEDIFDLSALRYLTGLKQLNLSNIAATDLSPLSGLTQLEGLTLRKSKASDYSALASLCNLTWLDLTGAAIADLTPLAGMSNLNALTLCYTDVTDLTPLQNLTKLFGLKLEGTHITDYSPVAALYSNLGKRDFILPEPGKVRFNDELLEARVRAAMNKPEGDITTEEAAVVTAMDLSQDENSETSIALLQGLEAFTGLTKLSLDGNWQVSDLWPLSGLTKLEKLNLRKCNIVSLKPISGLTGITELIMGWNGSVGRLDALAGLVNLEALDAKGVGITDISGLTGLPKLIYVGLNQNQIADMSPLATLPSLREAELLDNATTDFSALTEIYPKLTYKDFTIEAAGQTQLMPAPSADGDGWQYDEATRTLTIDNDAPMTAYKPDQENAESATLTNTPWAANLAQIEQIIVGDAVTHISDYAFAYTSALKKITIGKGVSSLGFRCLYRCGNWDAGEDLEIIVNCAAMPALGEDVMGYTWDNPQTFLSVPSSQADQWRKALHESRLLIVEQ